MSLSYKIFRRWHVWKLRRAERLSKVFENTEEKTNPEQDKALAIAKKVITDETSTLYYSGWDMENSVPTRCLAVRGHLVVRITTANIRIINGKYQYDVRFNGLDKRFLNTKRMFSRSVLHRLDKVEALINQRVERSLDHVLKGLNEPD